MHFRIKAFDCCNRSRAREDARHLDSNWGGRRKGLERGLDLISADVVVTTTVKRLRWQSGGYNDYSLLFIWLFILHGLYVHLPIHFCQAFYVCAWPVYVCAWPLYHYELNRSFWDTIIWIQIFWDMESMCMCGWIGLAMLSTKSCTKTFISFTDWSSSLLAVGSHAITTAKVLKSKSHH